MGNRIPIIVELYGDGVMSSTGKIDLSEFVTQIQWTSSTRSPYETINLRAAVPFSLANSILQVGLSADSRESSKAIPGGGLTYPYWIVVRDPDTKTKNRSNAVALHWGRVDQVSTVRGADQQSGGHYSEISIQAGSWVSIVEEAQSVTSAVKHNGNYPLHAAILNYREVHRTFITASQKFSKTSKINAAQSALSSLWNTLLGYGLKRDTDITFGPHIPTSLVQHEHVPVGYSGTVSTLALGVIPCVFANSLYKDALDWVAPRSKLLKYNDVHAGVHSAPTYAMGGSILHVPGTIPKSGMGFPGQFNSSKWSILTSTYDSMPNAIEFFPGLDVPDYGIDPFSSSATKTTDVSATSRIKGGGGFTSGTVADPTDPAYEIEQSDTQKFTVGTLFSDPFAQNIDYLERLAASRELPVTMQDAWGVANKVTDINSAYFALVKSLGGSRPFVMYRAKPFSSGLAADSTLIVSQLKTRTYYDKDKGKPDPYQQELVHDYIDEIVGWDVPPVIDSNVKTQSRIFQAPVAYRLPCVSGNKNPEKVTNSYVITEDHLFDLNLNFQSSDVTNAVVIYSSQDPGQSGPMKWGQSASEPAAHPFSAAYYGLKLYEAQWPFRWRDKSIPYARALTDFVYSIVANAGLPGMVASNPLSGSATGSALVSYRPRARAGHWYRISVNKDNFRGGGLESGSLFHKQRGLKNVPHTLLGYANSVTHTISIDENGGYSRQTSIDFERIRPIYAGLGEYPFRSKGDGSNSEAAEILLGDWFS